MELIDKAAVVAELERLISNGATKLKESEECKDYESYVALAERIATCMNVESFLDTLEVKEVYEHNDSDLDSILEEIGVETDSRLARLFKTAFYKGIDNYLAKKGE